jgi:hypothetical protein
LPWIAEGFIPTASSRIIAVLRNVDPCPGLPCRARRPPLAECRPKFISVTAWSVRFWECSTPSNWFNLYGNCYKFSISISPTASSRIIAVLRNVDPCPGLPCRARRPFPAERRPKFISVTAWSVRFWECSTPSNWFNLYGNCYKCSISISPTASSRIIAVLRNVDPRPGLPCRARSPPLAECRPKFISVTAWRV